MEKNNKSKIIIIILLFLVIAMGSFILYDKVLKDKYFSSNSKNSENQNKNEKEEDTSKNETNNITDDTLNTTINTNDNNNDTTSNFQNNSTNKVVEVSKQEIMDYVKKQLVSKNLVDQSNIEKWNFDKVTYMGYFKSNSNEKYYKISGVFKCKDSSYSCVYQEQLEDPNTNDEYPWTVVVPIIFNNDQYSFGSIGGSYEFYSPEFNLIEKDL